MRLPALRLLCIPLICLLLPLLSGCGKKATDTNANLPTDRKTLPVIRRIEESALQPAEGRNHVRDSIFLSAFAREFASRTVRPDPENRYFANLADHVGEYTISVRKVMGSRIFESFFYNFDTGEHPNPLNELWLSLQIVSKRKHTAEQIDNFALDLEAVDEKGTLLKIKESFPPTYLEKERGMARIFLLTTPAPGARFLRSLKGSFTLRKSPGINSIASPVPFRIQNIPLPVGTRIYATATTRFIPTAKIAGEGRLVEARSGVQIMDKIAIPKVLQVFRDEAPELTPATTAVRLVLQPDIQNAFRIRLRGIGDDVEADALMVSLQPHVGYDDEILTELKISTVGKKSASLSLPLHCWNKYPVNLVLPVVFLPKNTPPGQSLLLSFGFYLDLFRGQERYTPPQTPYPARADERGGILAGQFLVGSEPLPRARVTLSIERLGLSPPLRPIVTKLTLDEEGRCQFNNLSPGRYRVTMQGYQPNLSIQTRRSPLPEFVRHRYGIQNPALRETVQEDVLVRAGGRTVLRPWHIVEATKE